MTELAARAAVGYLRQIIAGRLDVVRGWFAPDVTIEDPRNGRVFASGIARHLDTQHYWLASVGATVEPIGCTGESGRAVAEQVLHLGFVTIHLSIVTDEGPQGVRAIRIYQSNLPLAGQHAGARPPMLAPRSFAIHGAVGEHVGGLAQGDLDRVLRAFEDDAVVVEPSGGAAMYSGLDEIRYYYSAILAQGGVPLEPCTITDDGVGCAIEYNVHRWGPHSIPAQAGVMVYHRGLTGRIATLRMYDDIDAPLGRSAPPPAR